MASCLVIDLNSLEAESSCADSAFLPPVVELPWAKLQNLPTYSVTLTKDLKGKKNNDDETPDRRPAAADVASPRPREVGGACRIQVLATARTRETVGGPNGATRSEFRRGCPPVYATHVKCDTSKPIMPSSSKPREQNYPFCPRRV